MNDVSQLMINEDETLDEVTKLNIKVFQKKDGWRFSIDSILLAAFADLYVKNTFLELGCGNGVISLFLTMSKQKRLGIGVDINQEAVKLANRSAKLNNLSERISFKKIDIKSKLPDIKIDYFQSVIINPPYRKPGTGKISPNESKAFANHELSATLNDFSRIASYYLINRGSLLMIHLTERLEEIITTFQKYHLTVKIVRFIHSFSDKPSKLLLIKAMKGVKSSMIVVPPLFIYSKPGKYSDEINKLIA